MSLFDKPLRVNGKHTGKLTVKWAALSDIETSDQSFSDDAIDSFLKLNSKLLKQLGKSKEELSVEWVSDDDNFENVNVEDFNFSTLTLTDRPSIKYLEVNFNFDTKLDVKKQADDIVDALRFGFSSEIEFSTKDGFVLFKFNELLDNSVEFE